MLDPPEDHLPEPQQVGQVARELALGSLQAGGPDDEAQALGGIQLVHDLAELAALAFVDDLARDADAVQARHQDEVAAGNADISGKGRALGADALLDDLDEHLVATAEDVLDGGLDHAAAAPRASGPSRLVTPARSSLDGAAQAHLSLQDLDLLDLLADLLLELGVDFLLGHPYGLGAEVLADRLFVLERGVVVILVIVEIELEILDLLGPQLLGGKTASRGGRITGFGLQLIEVGGKLIVSCCGCRLELGTLAVPVPSTAPPSPAPLAFPGLGPRRRRRISATQKLFLGCQKLARVDVGLGVEGSFRPGPRCRGRLNSGALVSRPEAAGDIAGLSRPAVGPASLPGELGELAANTVAWAFALRRAVPLGLGGASARPFGPWAGWRRRWAGALLFRAAVASSRPNRGSSAASTWGILELRLVLDRLELVGSHGRFGTPIEVGRLEAFFLEARKRSGRGRRAGGRRRASLPAWPSRFPRCVGLGSQSRAERLVAVVLDFGIIRGARGYAVTATLFGFDLVGLGGRSGRPQPLSTTGGQVRVKRFDGSRCPPSRFFRLLGARLAFPHSLSFPFAFILPTLLDRLWPRRGLGLLGELRGLIVPLRLLLEGSWWGSGGIGRSLSVFHKSFTESPRHFGSVAASPDRSVGPLPLPVAVAVAGPLLTTGWGGQGGRKRLVQGIGPGSAALDRAPGRGAALAAWIQAADPSLRRRPARARLRLAGVDCSIGARHRRHEEIRCGPPRNRRKRPGWPARD